MKKVLFVIAVAVSMASCKTAKVAEKPVVEPVVKETVSQSTAPVVENKIQSNIRMQEESVSVMQGEDKSEDAFSYYVIMGSFSVKDNALKFKSQLKDKGFSPVILENKTGNLRVSVLSTDSESEARGRIATIRSNYPEHADVWLLKKLK